MPALVRARAVLAAALISPLLAAGGAAPASAAWQPLSATVKPAVMAAAPKTTNNAAGRAQLAAWTARDAKAKATIAHLAAVRAAKAKTASRANPRAAHLRADADWAVRDAKAKATIAHLAAVRAAKAKTASDADRRASRASRSARTAPAAAPAGVWDRLAQCESGGNWAINTGNGYYGGLQFSLGSWRAVGGTGYPHQASKAEQIKRGELLKARQGWGAWPACSRKLGLR